MSDKKLLKIEEVAKKLRCARSNIYQYVALRKIPYIKLNGLLLFDEAKIDTWIDSKSHAPENS